jgi:hypothetical protein
MQTTTLTNVTFKGPNGWDFLPMRDGVRFTNKNGPTTVHTIDVEYTSDLYPGQTLSCEIYFAVDFETYKPVFDIDFTELEYEIEDEEGRNQFVELVLKDPRLYPQAVSYPELFLMLA